MSSYFYKINKIVAVDLLNTSSIFIIPIASLCFLNCRADKYQMGLHNSALEFWQLTVEESATRAVGPTALLAGSFAFLLSWKTKQGLVTVKGTKM